MWIFRPNFQTIHFSIKKNKTSCFNVTTLVYSALAMSICFWRFFEISTSARFFSLFHNISLFALYLLFTVPLSFIKVFSWSLKSCVLNLIRDIQGDPFKMSHPDPFPWHVKAKALGPFIEQNFKKLFSPKTQIRNFLKYNHTSRDSLK